MSRIYEPKGRAREYSPYALNLYRGCNHGCFYCYVPRMYKRFDRDYEHEKVKYYDLELKELKQTAKKFKDSRKQVLMSFTTDPYNAFNDTLQLTRKALKILLEYKYPVAILTKAGKKILKDLDIFKKFGKHIKVGFTLTYDNDEDSLRYEPQAAPFTERIETLKILFEEGIKTWISIEPVIKPVQSLSCIEKSLLYTDHYKIGKINYYNSIENEIDWFKFLEDVVNIMRINNKKFYIKKDLQLFKDNIILQKNEIDTDFLNVK